MGCYNITCGISQFPIFHGQKTVNFIIVENGWGTPVRPCYSTDTWAPLPVPIFGEYNDYGGQDDDDGQDAKYAFMKAWTARELIRTPEKEGEQDSYDRYPNVTEPFINGETIDRSTHAQKFSLDNAMGKRYSGKTHRNIAMFMMHRSVYDGLTAEYVQDYPERRVWTREELVAELDLYFVDFNKDMKAAKKSNGTDAGMAVFNMLHGGMYAQDWFKKKYGEKSYSHPMYGILMFYSERYSEGPFCSLREAHLAGAVTTTDIVQVYLMFQAMRSLRKSFHPQSGNGSQDDIEEYHTKMIELQKGLILERKKMFDEYEDEEEA